MHKEEETPNEEEEKRVFIIGVYNGYTSIHCYLCKERMEGITRVDVYHEVQKIPR